MENNRSPENPPKFIKVYNELLKNIEDGIYSKSGKIPSEYELSRQMKVSRMTLRRSITLLQEDGVIESRKGVGNFIRLPKEVSNSSGLESIGNVLSKCGITNVDKITCLTNLRTSELYTEKIFKREIQQLIAVNLYYFHRIVY